MTPDDFNPELISKTKRYNYEENQR